MKQRNPLSQSFFQGNRKNLFMAVLGTTVLSVGILSVPQLMQILIDFLSGNRRYSMHQIILMAIAVLLMVSFSGLCTYYFRTKFSTKAVFQYRKMAYHYLSKKKVTEFYGQNTAVYLSALNTDLQKIKEDFLDQIPILSQIVICGIGAVLVMIRYNFFLAMMACLISLIPFFAALFSGRNMEKIEENLSKENAEYLAFLKDFAIGFTIIKSYKVEGIFSALHDKICQKVEARMEEREKSVEKINYFAAISGYITQFAILLLCAVVAYRSKSISVGTVLAFSRLINYIIDPVTELPGMLSKARTAYALSEQFWEKIGKGEQEEQQEQQQKSGEIVKDGYHQHTDTDSHEKALPIPALQGDICFSHLSFSYIPEKQVLKDFTLRVKEGEKLILLGASGSGKSSILKLLMGIERSQGGEISIGNSQLSTLPEESLFRSISYIQQEVFIFDGSIYENITLFQKYSEEELKQVIEKSGLKNLILEKGLDYPCGENGAALSGGERQRINIARSLLRKTPILLADEITAALDKENSYLVLDSLLSLENITEILVLHDLDSRILSRVDRICVLKEGEIVEEGIFSELMEKKGYFYSLFMMEQ
ncbi:ABC transporter ATP-binding protein [Oribacterium sinus]|uniref:ABC transporter ATP-binding protein n=1 Tax=Oribacterium sinus TaxID=237576 RepID=A0A930DNM7_9FIRM|nr:ABC transporter ATP-binding protein [Oribacterium sinus]MBF1272724.1 ABC transporter ATP-binding protein [Oribacterium sinus]